MSDVELKDNKHRYYSVSTLQEIVDEIIDKHRWDIPKDGCYIGGIMTATEDLVGKLNARHPDVVITREAVDAYLLLDTIDELRAKNKELIMRKTLLEKDLKSARQDLNSKDTSIRSLEKQCDDLGKELTQLKNCDYFTIEQVRELVPPQKNERDVCIFEATFNSGWNSCVREMNDRIATTPPARHTLSEPTQIDDLNKLKAEVQALEERIKHLKVALEEKE